MTRIGSQLIFCSPQLILKRTVVERDEQNIITRLYKLDQDTVESAQTLFFDGIISSKIISLKQNIAIEKIPGLVQNFHYLDFSDNITGIETYTIDKPFLLDFGTNAPDKINAKLLDFARINPNISILDLIASCVYYPAKLLGLPRELTEKRQTELLLWENVDLFNKTLTNSTRIRVL